MESEQQLEKASINSISISLERARMEIPSYLGHAPRRIDNHFNGYKAAEWEAWLKYYGIPLLDQNLDDNQLQNFSDLSRIYTLATQYTIQQSELYTINILCSRFIQTYERLYYQKDPKRLSVCTVNIHYLTHLAAHIQDCGPARYWWQFPMERYCGIIKPMGRSKVQLNASIANAVVTAEMLHHAQFLRRASKPIHENYPRLLNRLRDESSSHALQKLTHFLNMENGFQSLLFRRCQLNSKLTIGSNSSQRRNDVNRRDDLICYQTDQQKWMFAQVIYFAKIRSPVQSTIQLHFLAFIRNYTDINIDKRKRVASFGREGGRSWIPVSWIQSLFGVIQEGGVNLIVTDIDIYK